MPVSTRNFQGTQEYLKWLHVRTKENIKAPSTNIDKSFNTEQVTLTCFTCQKQKFDKNRNGHKDDNQAFIVLHCIFKNYFISEFYIIVFTWLMAKILQ